MTGPILVTGGKGQLATALAEARSAVVKVVGRPAFDFDRPDTFFETLHSHQPALVVNAAAWTAVDAAEASPEAADRANHLGPAALARHCASLSIPLIHISTDYVFDGLKHAPYVETDPTNPTGVYGATKLAGERAVLAADPQAVILRTSWVYARAGRNFVLTMLDAGRRLNQLRVVADQIGCPTNADDLAHAVLGVCDHLLSCGRSDHGLGGVYHAAGQGDVSWHGLALAVFEAARPYGWAQPQVQAIATSDWPTPARRPPDSRLDCRRLKEVFGQSLPHWQSSLGDAVAAICTRAPVTSSV